MNTASTAIAILSVISSSGVQSSNPNDGLCDAGHYMDYDSHTCPPCPMNTFSSTKNRAAQCEPCSKKCFDERNAEVLHHCNSTQNLTCRCKLGQYATTDRSLCRRHITCPLNCTKQPGTPSSNTVCYEPCPTSVSNSHAGYTTTPSSRDVKKSDSSQTVPISDVITGSSISPSNNSADNTVNKESRTIEPNTSQSNAPVIVLAVVLSIAAVATVIAAAVWFILKRRRGRGRDDYEEVPYNGGNAELENNMLQAAPELPDRTLYSNGRCRQRLPQVIHDGEDMPLESGVEEPNNNYSGDGPSGDNGQEGSSSDPVTSAEPRISSSNTQEDQSTSSTMPVNLPSVQPGYSRASTSRDSASRPVASVAPQSHQSTHSGPQNVPGNPPPNMNQAAPGPGNLDQVHEVEAVLEQDGMD